MAGWDEVLRETQVTPGSYDVVRRKYLYKLSEYTHRNTIAYYSGFLTNGNHNNIDINDSDMTGFMNALTGVDTSNGLDLILHTPGGNPMAAEAIISYLRNKFSNNIRVIVPQIAMSAGTMMACAGKTIIMGKHSSLGPVDPQFNGTPAYEIIQMYNEARDNLKSDHPEVLYWKLVLERYAPAFVYTALSSINLASELVRKWLGTCMFNALEDASKIEHIVQQLNNHKDTKAHGRHFDVQKCREIGLNITDLESDSELQDRVLSIHHAYMLTFNNTTAEKIIENHDSKAWICNRRT